MRLDHLRRDRRDVHAGVHAGVDAAGGGGPVRGSADGGRMMATCGSFVCSPMRHCRHDMKRTFALEDLGGSSKQCRLSFLKLVMGNRRVPTFSQLHTIKLVPEVGRHCRKQVDEQLFPPSGDRLGIRPIEVVILGQMVKILLPTVQDATLRLGAPVLTESHGPIERQIDHVECPYVVARQPRASGRHKRMEYLKLSHSRLARPLDPFLGLHGKYRTQQRCADNQPIVERHDFSRFLGILAC